MLTLVYWASPLLFSVCITARLRRSPQDRSSRRFVSCRASAPRQDLWDEDRDDVVHRLVFEVDDG